MRLRRPAVVALAFLLVLARHSAAQENPIHDAVATVASSTALTDANAEPQSPAPRVVAFEYSDAYKTRAKIHKYASFATLPLFATEFALGQSLYSNPSDSKKGAHIAVGTSIIGLYGVQAVTGVWNLVEAEQGSRTASKNGAWSTAILMLASGAGFAITPMTRRATAIGSSPASSASTHRAVAFTSIGIGTAGYLLMLFGGK